MRGTETAKALGLLEHALAALAAGGRVSGSWHVIFISDRLLLR
jgi:hypothetical protein